VTPHARLVAIKLVHTLAWAFFVICILLIPLAALAHRFGVALGLIAVVFLEVMILVANGWQCPLTGVAGRYTTDREDNFDIYLPRWLARHNKRIFGALYVAGLLVTAWQWHSVPP
jgi:hypothetical protein